MAFFTRFVTGAALAGGLTYYYHVDVIETTQHLRKELEDLSRQLVDTVNVAPRPETRLEANAIPLRVGVKESVKARWNETVEQSVTAFRETDWAAVAYTAFETAKSKLQRTPNPVEVVPEAGRQV